MDENTRLILEKSRSAEARADEEPMRYDLKSLLEEGRKSILTPEGERLIREATQKQPPKAEQK